MKNILIITEHDAIERRLNRFVDNLFSNESKMIYLCNINLVDCSIMQYHYPMISTKTKILATKLGSIGIDVYQHSSSFEDKMQATSCEDINKIIANKNIDCVLIPIFINDKEHWEYYKKIADEIKKFKPIEIVGLVIE